MRNRGCLFPITMWFFKRFHCLTLFGWIECHCKCAKDHKAGVEGYTILWLLLLSLLFFINPASKDYWYNYFPLALAIWRLFDILTTTIRKTFLEQNIPKCPPRSLILTLLNYIEIIIIFSIINYNPSFTSASDSLRFSFELFVPLISSKSIHLPIAYWLFVVEISISLIYHIAIIQRLISYFK